MCFFLQNQVFANASEKLFIPNTLSDLSSQQLSDFFQSIDDHQYSNIITSLDDQHSEQLNHFLHYSSVGAVAIPASGLFVLRHFLSSVLKIPASWLVGISAATLSAVYLGHRAINQSSSDSVFSSTLRSQQGFDEVEPFSNSTTPLEDLQQISSNSNPSPNPLVPPVLYQENPDRDDGSFDTEGYQREVADSLLTLNQNPQVFNKLILDSLFFPSSIEPSKIDYLKVLVTLVLSLPDDQIRTLIKKNIDSHLDNDRYKWILEEKVDGNYQSKSFRDLYLNQDFSQWDQQTLSKFILSQVTSASSLHVFLKYFFDVDSSSSDSSLAVDYHLIGGDGNILQRAIWSKRIEMLKLIVSFNPRNYVQRHGPLADDNVSINQLTDIIKTMSDTQIKSRISSSLWSVFGYKLDPSMLQTINSQSIVEFIESLKTPGKQYFFVSSVLLLIENSLYDIVSLNDSVSESVEQLDSAEELVLMDFFNYFVDHTGLQSLLLKYHVSSPKDQVTALKSHSILTDNFDITEDLASAFKSYVFTYLIDDDPLRLTVALARILKFNEELSMRHLAENNSRSVTSMHSLKENILKSFVGFYKRIITQTTDDEVMHSLDQYQDQVSQLSDRKLKRSIRGKLKMQVVLPKTIKLKPKLRAVVNNILKLDPLHQRVFFALFLKIDKSTLESIALHFNVSVFKVREVQKHIYKLLSVDIADIYLTLDQLVDKYHALSDAHLVERFYSQSSSQAISSNPSQLSRSASYIKDFIDEYLAIDKNKYYIFLSLTLGLNDVDKYYLTEYLQINDKKFSNIRQRTSFDVNRFYTLYNTNLELTSRYKSLTPSQLSERIKESVLKDKSLSDYIDLHENFTTIVSQIVSDSLLVQDVFFSLFLNLRDATKVKIANDHKISLDIVKQTKQKVLNMLMNQPGVTEVLSLDQLKDKYNSLDDADLVQRFSTLSSMSNYLRNIDREQVTAKLIREVVSSSEIFSKDRALHLFLSRMLKLDNVQESDLIQLYSLRTSVIKDIRYKIYETFGFYFENIQEHKQLVAEFNTLSAKQIFDLLKSHNRELAGYVYSKDHLLSSVNTILNSDILTQRVFFGLVLKLNSDTPANISNKFNIKNRYRNNNRYHYIDDIKLLIFDILYDPLTSVTVLGFDQLKQRYNNLSDFELVRRIKSSKYMHAVSASQITSELVREFVSLRLSKNSKLQHLFFSMILRLDNATIEDFSHHFKNENYNQEYYLKNIQNNYLAFYKENHVMDDLLKEVNSLDDQQILSLLTQNIKKDRSLPNSINFKQDFSEIIEKILNSSLLHQHVFLGLMLNLGDVSAADIKILHKVSSKKINLIKSEIFDRLNHSSQSMGLVLTLDQLKQKLEHLTDSQLMKAISQLDGLEGYSKVLDPSADLIRAYVQTFSIDQDVLLHIFLSQMLKLDDARQIQIAKKYSFTRNGFHFERKRQKLIDGLIDFSLHYHILFSLMTEFNKLDDHQILELFQQNLVNDSILADSIDFKTNYIDIIDQIVNRSSLYQHVFLSLMLNLDEGSEDLLSKVHGVSLQDINKIKLDIYHLLNKSI